MQRNVIVNYHSLERALNELERPSGNGPALTLESTRDASSSDAAAWLMVHRALRKLEQDGGEAEVLTTSQDAVTSLLQSYLAEQAGKKDQTAPLPTGGFEAKFDTHDLLGWVSSFFSWWRQLSPHDWKVGPIEPIRIANTARIGLLSDWGTGLYGAPVCAQTIRQDPLGFDYLIHLGDVYYSGTENEIQTRFLSDWPMVARQAHLALNSNHEMYSGGYGYFDVMLPALAEHSKSVKQDASYFALENDYFVLVALDTGYVEHNLAADQAQWLRGIVNTAGNKRIILFSHHQPFSLFEEQGTQVVAKLRDILERRQIFAWYWGHEHRLVIYDEHPEWKLIGRCIGHGGMPYFRDKLDRTSTKSWELLRVDGNRQIGFSIPAGRVLDGPNPYVAKHEVEYGPNGFAILELDRDTLYESHRLPDGTKVYDRKLA